MSGDLIAIIVGVAASLVLATRALGSRRLGTNKIAQMAAIWVLIIAVLAFLIQRFAA